MIGMDLIRQIESRLRNVERRQVTYRRGQVTQASPLAVSLGGGEPVEGIASLATGLQEDDLVHALTFGNDLLVLGHTIPGRPLRNTGSSSFSGSTANVSTFTTWTNGPEITVPATGQYDAMWGCSIGSASPVTLDSRVAIAVNGTVALAQNPIVHTTASQWESGSSVGEARLDLQAGDVLTLRIATNGNTAAVGTGSRWLKLSQVGLA